MCLVAAQFGFCKAVIRQQGAICGAYVRATAAFHTQIDTVLIEFCHLILGIHVECLRKDGGVEEHRTRLYALATVNTSGYGAFNAVLLGHDCERIGSLINCLIIGIRGNTHHRSTGQNLANILGINSHKSKNVANGCTNGAFQARGYSSYLP